MYRQITKILLISALFFIMPLVAQAGFLDEVAYCTQRGNCNFNDIAVAINSFIKLLLGGLGAVALIYFVFGGIQWLISGGNAERVQRGKQIMINTTFAIILTFGAYIIVNFFINDILNVKDEYRVGEGSFVESCEGKAIETSCGEGGNKQCTGQFEDTSPWLSLSNKCLYTCQVQGLLASDYTKIGVCVTAIEAFQGVEGDGTMVKVPQGDASCIAPQDTCVYRK